MLTRSYRLVCWLLKFHSMTSEEQQSKQVWVIRKIPAVLELVHSLQPVLITSLRSAWIVSTLKLGLRLVLRAFLSRALALQTLPCSDVDLVQ